MSLWWNGGLSRDECCCFTPWKPGQAPSLLGHPGLDTGLGHRGHVAERQRDGNGHRHLCEALLLKYQGTLGGEAGPRCHARRFAGWRAVIASLGSTAERMVPPGLDGVADTGKVSHSSHGKKKGLVLVLGQGEAGQLGLGEDIMERKKPALVSLPEGVLQAVARGGSGGGVWWRRAQRPARRRWS
ncbi:hypothetical protein AAFF_G00058140 [Aldrovandia affinis]|uniref:Uncharacterized protein n=1 Tax=Aldrovandia affinis TaxID=143900 RepID=A0AAD7S090_9TELE|nr:hypothetical protein AAFF_G00058140 [Aldrovandia affinis]